MSFPYEIIERPFNKLLREPPFREGQTMGGREEVLRCSEHHGSRSALLGTHGARTSQISAWENNISNCVCVSECMCVHFILYSGTFDKQCNVNTRTVLFISAHET